MSRRFVPAAPRKFHSPKHFTCPTDQQHGLKALRAKIERGDDINENLSRNLRYADYNDLLLWDWDIHHFHLGVVVDEQGFVTRFDALLVRAYHRDGLLCHPVLGHDFVDQELLRIM